MPCQFPNTMHCACNLPSHLNCNDSHRSTYVGIILQVYEINYMSYMPDQKTRHPQNQNDSIINHMTCIHTQSVFNPSFHLAVDILPSTGMQSDCEQACADAEFTTYEALFVRCWQLGKIHNHITPHTLKTNTLITK